jgi:hypothetical protein
METIKVKDLIEYLKTFDKNLPVAYKMHSEAKLLILEDIQTKKLQPARSDGWVHDIWGVDKMLPEIEYLLFPGN